MKPIATTKMSSKGQVVIPEGIRQQLGLDPGTQFVVVGQKDVIILKTIIAPAMSQFDGLVKQVRKQAKQAGLTRSDITKAVAEAAQVQMRIVNEMWPLAAKLTWTQAWKWRAKAALGR